MRDRRSDETPAFGRHLGRRGVGASTGLALGQELGLSPGEETELAARAAKAGYTSLWTNSGTGEAAFASCERFAAAGAGVTGILVIPSPVWDTNALGSATVRTSRTTEDRFILGIGFGATGDVYRARVGPAGPSPVELMRRQIGALRSRIPGTRVYLAALGPAMLRLAGAVADGAALNWCTAEHVRWSRQRVAEGATGAGRDPADVQVVEYIRVAVDGDVALARHALAKAVLGYALGRAGRSGYRSHFGRMGLEDVLRELDSRRAGGAGADALADEFPAAALERIGYAGPAAGARAALARLGAGLDVAIARVVSVRPGTESVRAVIDAHPPAKRAGG